MIVFSAAMTSANPDRIRGTHQYFSSIFPPPISIPDSNIINPQLPIVKTKNVKLRTLYAIANFEGR